MAQIVRTTNPLFPANGKEQYFIKADLVGKTLGEILRTCDIVVSSATGNTAVFVNDERIDWDQLENVTIEETDLISVKQLVSGGGGSNIWSVVLMIALVVADIYTVGALTPEIGALYAGMVGAAIMIVGSLLINKFLGPAFPGASSQATNALYSITGSSNQERLGQPMPIVFGTYLMAPDVGAAPYVVYEGNDQYLYEIFNFGYSDLDIGPLSIGSTLVSDYSNVTIQWSDSNGALTLFPGNVDVSAGATLTHAGGPVTRTTAVNCTSVGIDITATLFMTNSNGTLANETVVIYPQYKLTTDSTWTDLIPHTAINPADGYLNIYADGGQGRFFNYQSQNMWTLTNDTSTPYVQTYTATLPAAGQYDIKLTRQTADIDDTTHYADTTWAQLKSYQPDNTDYSGQTRLAIKIQANNQLNGTISQLQTQVTAKCPVYNSTTSTWTTQGTSNPAWWYLWFARGKFDSNGVRILGEGLPDSQIDIPGIIEWAAWCDANDLAFNYILGDVMTVDDVYSLITRVGRATKTRAKGILGVVYDQEGLPVTQMFGMSNIKAGSFAINYISDQLAQQVNVQFINPDLQYAQDQVSAIVPGVTSPEFSSTIFIPGITSKTQAAQEANLQAAAQVMFRKTTTFETDIEGLVCNRGDVIMVSHDLASWGQSGRLVSGTETQVVLDREVTITAGTQPYLMVRHPDGTIETVEVHNIPGTTTTLNLLASLTQSPNAYAAPLVPRDAIYSFDPAQTPGRLLKVLAVEPQGNNDNWIKLTCRDEIPAYYDSATNPDWSYVNPVLLNQGGASLTNVTFTENTNVATGEVTVTIGWTLHQAAGAKLLLQTGVGSWVDEGTIYAQQYVQTFAKPTTINVQLTPVALAGVSLRYPTTTASYAMIGSSVPPEQLSALVPDVTGLQLVGSDPAAITFNGQDAKFQWRLSSTSAPEVGSEPNGGDSGTNNPYFRDFEIQIANPDGTIRRTEYTKNTTYIYTFEMNFEDGNGVAARAFVINVTTRGQQNQLSEHTANLSVSNPPPSIPTGINITGMLSSIAISFDSPTDTDYAGCLIYGSTVETDAAGAGPITLDAKLNNNVLLANLTSGVTYYLYLSPYDQFGKTGLNVSSQYTCATVLIATIDLGPGSVTSTILANAAVTTAKIVPGAVDSTIIAANAVTNAALAAAAVATANIQPSAITNSLLAANAVATANIQPAAVTNALIAANAVGTLNINTGAITTALIASGAVTGANIAANTINTVNLVAGSITTTQIAAGTIQAGNIAANTITGSLIAANTIIGSNLVAGTITSTQISANAITATQLAAGSVTAASILAGTITSTQIAANSIVASNIQAGTLTAATMAAGTITATQIAASTITASNIAAATITGSLIAASTILGSNIAAATITGGNITALSITAGNIAANTITGSKIAANTIVAGNIASNTITSTQLAVLSAGGTSIDMTAGNIVINNGTTMKVIGDGFGASSAFIEWAGPTQSSASNYAACTTSNATSYLTTTGDAGFSGSINITTSGISGLNGYIKHPPNLAGIQIIEQWGYFEEPAASPCNVPFNITFPNNCMNVSFSQALGNESIWINALYPSYFSITFGASYNYIYWRAVGY